MDAARSQLVPNGPEEYVRQDVLRSLIEVYGYPRLSLLSEEQVARGTSNRQRADVLVELLAEARGVHEIIVWDGPTANDEQEPCYASIVSELKARLGDQEAVHFVGVPETLDVAVNGQPVVCRVLGFKEEGQALGLWLRPPEPLKGLPPELCLHVLGYGMTRHEREIARSIGLPTVEFSDPDKEEFEGCYQALFGLDEKLGICAGGCAAESGTCGWLVLRADSWHRYGALVRIDASSAEWGRLFRSRANEMSRIPLFDEGGRVAVRADMDALRPGDRVFIMPPDDSEPFEGSIARIVAPRVVVDCGRRGTVEATLELRPDRPWVMGRVPDEGPLPDVDAGQRTKERWRTFIVVECKAPHVSFSEEVKNQGLGYAKARGARFLVLTNGDWRCTFLLDGREGVEVEDIPTYTEAVSNCRYEVAALRDEPSFEPLPAEAAQHPDVVRFHARYRDVIGADVPEHIWRPILLLDDI